MGVRYEPGRRLIGLLTAGTATAAALAAFGTVTAAAGPAGSSRPATRSVRLTTAEQDALLRLYASYLRIPRGDIAGVRPGTLHAARQPAGTEWATASFLPALADPPQVLLRFQDGASTVVFTAFRGRPWQIARAGGPPLSCPGVLPPAVRRAWRLTGTAGCPVSAARPRRSSHRGGQGAPAAAIPAMIVQVANQNVGIGDTPASTNFSFNCNPYTTMAGVLVSHRRCRIDRHFAVRNENELWCADFAKWVWVQGGVTTSLATLTPAASSFYTWGRLQGEHMPADSAAPVAGDAVVFYPANEKPGDPYADHVGLVAAVNPDGTVNLVNGDFAGTANITVQANNEVSLRPWASAMWGPGEKWVFVSPIGQSTARG